ncbi:MAG: LysE family translocator [Planctomycetes bacterium]|nr:LysE family translocator [Planctomycetota bacterium]
MSVADNAHMAWDTWFGYFWLSLLSSLAPGPAVLFVVAQGLRCGVWRSVGASLGILLANACFFVLAGFGVGALLQSQPVLYAILRWGGVLFVAWLGVQCLRSRGLSLPRGKLEQAGALSSFGALLWRGFVLQFANPKALIFFGALLPPFLDIQSTAWPIGWQVFVLGATSLVEEFFVLLGYGWLSGAASARLQNPNFAQWLDRVAGGMLLTIAAWVVWRG